MWSVYECVMTRWVSSFYISLLDIVLMIVYIGTCSIAKRSSFDKYSSTSANDGS